MVKRWFGLILALSLPLGAASGLDFSASSLTSSGASSLTGQMPALHLVSPNDHDEVGWKFELTGADHVTIQHAEKVAVGSAIAYQPAAPTGRSFDTQESWTGAQWMNGSSLFLRDIPNRPLPSIALQASTSRVEAVLDGCAGPPQHFGGQLGPQCREMSGTLNVEAFGASRLSVSGDFDVLVWGWTIQNGATSIETGERAARAIGALQMVNQTTAWLRVENGQMRIEAGTLSGLHATHVTLANDGMVVLHGPLDQPAATIRLEGKSVLNVEPQSGLLAVAVVRHESIVTQAPEGPLLADHVSAPRAIQPPYWIASLVAGLLIGLLLVARFVRPGRRVNRISKALATGENDKALRLASHGGLPSGAGPLFQVIAHLKAGNVQEAERALAAGGGEIEPAAREYLWANIEAARSNPDLARKRLQRAIELDSGYEFEASLNSSLRNLLGPKEQGGEAYS